MIHKHVGMASRSSVPAERVLRGNRGRDVGSAARIARAATSTAVAVSASSTGTGTAIVGEVPAEEGTSHQRWATGTIVAHLRRALAVGDRAGAAVGLSLALVSPGNDEHGSSVHDAEANRTHGNASSGGLLLRGLVSLVLVVEGIVVRTGAAGRDSTARRAAGAAVIDVAVDVDFGVDQGSQVSHDAIGVVVDARVGRPQVHLELVDQVLGVVELGNGGEISPLSPSIVRHQLGDLNLVGGEAAGVGEGLRQELEDLGGGNGVACDEDVVEREQKANLDRHAALRGRFVGIIRKDELGNIGGQSLGTGLSR